MAFIREIFTSIQGEGPFIGYKQLFLRFCRCNLNCLYCDTDFNVKKAKDYSVSEIINICNQNSDCHSISMTGGEPLLDKDFIKEIAINCNLPIYLETNGTLVHELKDIIEYIDYVSADIKLPSCTGQSLDWTNQDKFFSVASDKVLFAKAVFDSNITNEEIEKITALCKKYDIELILQPMMQKNIPSVASDFMLATLDKCLKQYHNVRLIPQMHKFINVE